MALNLFKQCLMWYLIKGFSEIQVYYVHTVTHIHSLKTLSREISKFVRHERPLWKPRCESLMILKDSRWCIHNISDHGLQNFSKLIC